MTKMWCCKFHVLGSSKIRFSLDKTINTEPVTKRGFFSETQCRKVAYSRLIQSGPGTLALRCGEIHLQQTTCWKFYALSSGEKDAKIG